MKFAVIIPTHSRGGNQGKFEYALKALETYNQVFEERDLYFIFSNQQECELFRSLTTLDFKHFVVDDNTNFPNIITYKKFYGNLQLFAEGYDYVLMLDSETEFVRWLGVEEVKSIFDKKVIKKNTSRDGGRLIKLSADILGLTNELAELSNDYRDYWWYNEVGIYERESFLEFFDSIQPIYSRILAEGNYFDYLLYSVWLIANKGFTTYNPLPDRKFVYGAIEHNFHDNTISEAFKSIADANTNYQEIPHIKIRVNTDRANNESIYLTQYYEVFE